MEVRLFDKKTDLEVVKAWLPFDLDPNELPAHTYCAVEDEIVAIAALRFAEGKVCLIDSMASNQKLPGRLRNEALDRLTETILNKAKEVGFKCVLGWTKEEVIVARALRHGFKYFPQLLIVREL